MARKGIAVSQIILLVLGILVLAVVAYLLYTNFVTTSTTISAETCRAAATRACTACSIATAGQLTGCAATTYLSKNDQNCVPSQISTDASGNILCQNYVGPGASGGATTPTKTTTPPPLIPTSLACNTCDKLNVGGTTGWTATLGGTGCQNPSSGATQTCPP